MDKRLEERRRQYKKAVDTQDARRKREDMNLQLRKQKREENLQKKRLQDEDSVQLEQTVIKPDFKTEHLPMMVAGVMSDNPDEQYKWTQQFRKLLSIQNNPPISEVIEAGVIQRFVEFLKVFDRPQLQFEAAWALTNVASGTAEQTAVVIERGAVPLFVGLLSSKNDDVREQAVWALGNIAGDSPRCRDLVLQAGALAPLLEQMKDSERFSMLRNATWTLSNLCRGKPLAPFEWVAPGLPTLMNLLYSADVEVLADACWALSYLSDGPNQRIEAVIQAGVCRRLVDLLLHTSPLVQTPALRTVGNIVTGDDKQTQVIISCQAIPNLLTLLSSSKKVLRKEACWTLSNITAGNRAQIQEVINAGCFPPLVRLLVVSEFDIKKEAAWAISNATSGGSLAQVEFLVNCNCIPPLCDLLEVSDAKIISVALEALENILNMGRTKQRESGAEENPWALRVEQCDGISKLEALNEDPNEEIYNRAVRILETFFPEVDDENDPVEVKTDGQQPMGGVSGAQPQGFAPFGAAANTPAGGFNFSG
eukprot:GDKH01016573.1.p1 GENE.GDKH01016573.1~~GDKH01016573.1.p1  ORF type:complete len:536 (-),score=184.00 GDKH01016573.1:252-1859(-)